MQLDDDDDDDLVLYDNKAVKEDSHHVEMISDGDNSEPETPVKKAPAKRPRKKVSSGSGSGSEDYTKSVSFSYFFSDSY